MARRSVKSSVLTAEGLPVWSLPANAAPDKKRAWERAMIEWVGDYLDIEHMEELNEVSEPDDSEVEVEELAFNRANRGDYGSLRKLYPRLAPYLNPPRLGRGQKFPKAIELGMVGLAALDVPLVRRLFQRVYGKKRRPRGDPYSVEAIVAMVYNTNFFGPGGDSVTEDEIEARMKTSGKYKMPRKR